MKGKKKIIFSLLIITITFITTFLLGDKNNSQHENEKVAFEHPIKDNEEIIFDYPPMIFWKDTLYVIKGEVDSSELENLIETRIGEIEKVIDGSEKPKTNGVANDFKKGCSIYTLREEQESKIIVVKYDKKYYAFESSRSK